MKYEDDSWSIESAIEKGRDLPEWYVDEPEIEKNMIIFVKIFQTLATCRQLGMGVGPIPWSAIADYCRYHEYDHDTSDTVFNVIQIMDSHYLEYQRDKKDK